MRIDKEDRINAEKPNELDMRTEGDEPQNLLVQWDLEHVWHPFTQANEWEADGPPLVVESAEGVELVDIHGNRYLDGISSLWTNVHGHRHPTIDTAVREQLDRVAHTTLLGLASKPSVLLARRLIEVVRRSLKSGVDDPLSRVFYSDSGSTAVEVALKQAFQCQQQRGETKRTRFAALDQAYHGDTIGSVSVGGIPLFHQVYRPMLFDAVRIPSPERADPEVEASCLQQARRLFDEHGEELAALIVEPLVQGASGMRMHSPHFLRELLELARSHGALIIVDEVATGFGRTGTMFAMEQVDFYPDFLCMAKGLTGGYAPLAATITRESVYEAFRGEPGSARAFFHGHTFTGNALACAAALASLRVFEEEEVMSDVAANMEALSIALSGLPDVVFGERRQTGVMAAVEVRFANSRNCRIGHRVCMAARSHGVVVRPLGDWVVFMPALAMHVDQIGRLVQSVGDAALAVKAAMEAGS